MMSKLLLSALAIVSAQFMLTEAFAPAAVGSPLKTLHTCNNNNNRQLNNIITLSSSPQDNNQGVIDLTDDDDEDAPPPTTADQQAEAAAAPFLSQGELSDDPNLLSPDLTDAKQTRVIIYIILTLIPVLFLIPLMLGSRDLIPLDALPPVEMSQ